VRQQNQELRDRVSRLQLEQAGLLEDARQGQRLQALLGFKEHYIYSTVPAQVIGTSGTDQSRILTIDKGFKDGLKPDNAVITPDGIVGKLRDVFGHTSQVLVISDQTSGAGVLLESTRLRGVLRGNALGQPQIINMLPDERVKPGERVITSGGDQIYPRGLPVGVVDRVVPDTSNPPYIDIIIKPAANLGHLEELLVITEASDRMPPTAQQDLAQSAAEGAAAANKQRASDILAERLPGLSDPNALADPGPDQKPGQKPPTPATTVPPPLHPPPAVHPDHYSPDATPPAGSKTTASKIPEQGADATAQKPAQKTDTGAAAKPKHPATSATPGQEASPGSALPKPKVPKVTEPAATVPAPEPSPDSSTGPPASAGDGSQPH
jgi:rod shape-determining protein MreC